MDKKAAIESAQIGMTKLVVAEQTLNNPCNPTGLPSTPLIYLNAKDDLATQQSTTELANKIFKQPHMSKYREGLVPAWS